MPALNSISIKGFKSICSIEKLSLPEHTIGGDRPDANFCMISAKFGRVQARSEKLGDSS
jgi:hypothetical protein